MTDEAIDKHYKEQNKIKEQIVDKLNEKRKKYVQEKKDEFKLLSKEEQEKVKIQIMLKKNEFNYIENIIKDNELFKHIKGKYKNNKIVVVDPGSRSPMTMINTKHVRFDYRKRRRIKELKRNKYTRLRQNKFNKLIKDTQTDEILKELMKLNKKTTYFAKFIEYIGTKILFLQMIKKQQKTYSDYNNKLKWFSYINKSRHEDKLLNELESKYGKDAVFIIGDWSKRNSCIKGMCMPNMGMKRLLKKRFEVYLIDEFNTSKINYVTHKEQEHLKIPITFKREGVSVTKVKEIYSILTYQMLNKRIGCINRDFNATLNMLRIVQSLMEGKERPRDLTRTKKSINLKH
jgi:hypothetical protein